MIYAIDFSRKKVAATVQERERVLTNAVLKVSELLDISNEHLAKILNVKTDLVSMFKVKKNTLEIDTEPFRNGVLLVRLYQSLSVLTGGEQKVCRSWMTSYNTALEDSPINVMVGDSRLEDVVKYLESTRFAR